MDDINVDQQYNLRRERLAQQLMSINASNKIIKKILYKEARKVFSTITNRGHSEMEQFGILPPTDHTTTFNTIDESLDWFDFVLESWS